MQSIGVQLKNGGQRPPTAPFSHKGRRKKAAADIHVQTVFKQQDILRSSLRAKRSNPAWRRELESWIASSLSLLAMTSHGSASSRRGAPELLQEICPSK